MNISLEQTQRLEELNAQRDTYTYQGPPLENKVLVALIGPTATGKSTLIDEILSQCTTYGIDAGETGTITTRERREGSDPANYVTASEGVTHTSMIDLIERGQLTNWSLFPTGHVYGGTIDSLPATYNFSPLIPDSLPMLQRAGFRAIYALYITVDPHQWSRQMAARQDDPKQLARINEAVTSLTYANEHFDELQVISNPEGQLTRTAEYIIDIITDKKQHSNTSDQQSRIDAMLSYALQLQEELHGNA